MKTLALHLFPNPSNGLFTVNLPVGERVKCAVYNLQGAGLLSGTTAQQLDLRRLSPGMYTVVLSSGNAEIMRKVVIDSRCNCYRSKVTCPVCSRAIFR